MPPNVGSETIVGAPIQLPPDQQAAMDRMRESMLSALSEQDRGALSPGDEYRKLERELVALEGELAKATNLLGALADIEREAVTLEREKVANDKKNEAIGVRLDELARKVREVRVGVPQTATLEIHKKRHVAILARLAALDAELGGVIPPPVYQVVVEPPPNGGAYRAPAALAAAAESLALEESRMAELDEREARLRRSIEQNAEAFETRARELEAKERALEKRERDAARLLELGAAESDKGDAGT